LTFETVVNRLEDIAVPTICRLNGGVYGGSTDLALACDFRIGVDSCEMFMPAARLGLHYYKSGIARYVSRLGVDNAEKLFLTARKIGAVEMLRIGYPHRRCFPPKLLTTKSAHWQPFLPPTRRSRCAAARSPTNSHGDGGFPTTQPLRRRFEGFGDAA
jgi:enoyl-CoA hydratase/carnithine racemase